MEIYSNEIIYVGKKTRLPLLAGTYKFDSAGREIK
jgi:hypothetical protein